MLPQRPYGNIDRLGIAFAFLSEVRQAEGADCALTSRSRGNLQRRVSRGDEDAFVELLRRRDPKPVAA